MGEKTIWGGLKLSTRTHIGYAPGLSEYGTKKKMLKYKIVMIKKKILSQIWHQS